MRHYIKPVVFIGFLFLMILSGEASAQPIAASGPPVYATPSDSLPAKWKHLEWRLSAGINGSWVIPTNSYLRGDNLAGASIPMAMAGRFTADFSFNPESQTARIYPGLYQGFGVDVRTFFHKDLLGAPVSLYILQGMPFKRFTDRLTLGYEWRFGCALGWKHIYSAETNPYNNAVSTNVTAHMEVGLKLHYLMSRHWQLNFGWEVIHFSNANTSWPNKGINMTGLSMGVSYLHGDRKPKPPTPELDDHFDSGRRWFCDMLAYTGWHKKRYKISKGVYTSFNDVFVVNGLRVGPMYQANRYLRVGGMLDLKYDQASRVMPIGEVHENKEIKEYTRPSIFRQFSLGILGGAELAMPVFSVNASVGYNFLCPKGDKRFYQSLTVKAFVYSGIYLNVGYQIANFSEPLNLTLGIGALI